MKNNIIRNIKKQIKKNNLVYWFNIKQSKGILVAKGTFKNEASNNLIDKINNKTEKYINSRLWRLSINFHKLNNEKLIFGEISINVENFIVVELENEIKIKKNPEIGHTGIIWFKKNWLETYGWDNSYILNIVIKLLQSKNKKLKITAPNIYHLLF